MSLRTRALLICSLSGAMVWGGFQASVLRARGSSPAHEVIAAAGGEPGLFSGGESQPESDTYRISALSIFSNVAIHVKDNYVDPARIDPKDMLRSALREIERQVAEVLVEDLDDGRVKVSVPGHSKTVVIKDVESLWEINIKLRDLFRFFEKHLPPQKDMRAVEYAAVNGALSTLDPHSILLEPKAFDEMKTSTKGEFGGLGIVISVRDAKLTIISPLEGTPASRAGLKAMDVITRIGEVSTVSMAIDEAVRLLRGREGSKVTIWVQRKGWPEARKFTLTRELIKIESISSKLLAGNVGYVRIKNFQQNTGRDLEDHITKLEKDGKAQLSGLILDLRNNPGGLLEQAIRVSDKFLTSGDIVTTVGYGNKLREPKRAQWASSDLDIPIVVLVNNGSASASEIVAGALKNLDRALIVGERTFGKGSVQVLYDFADNSALKLTIAQYLTPGGISIQSVGVAPDVELKPARVEERGVQLFYEPDHHREGNLKKHLDRQAASEAPSSEPAAERITYLEETKPEPTEAAEEEEEEVEEQGRADDYREDFPIRLARRVLTEGGRSKRSEMLSTAKAILRQAREEEEQKISQALSGLGLDWSEGEGVASALSAELRIKNHPEPRVVAGETVELEARVTNAGASPLFRVRGQLETEHPSFRAREFMFGKIAPGETRSWAIKVKIPKESDARSDVLSLKLGSSQGPVETTAHLPLSTQAVPHPQFAYGFSIDDRERGDGDGILERGEGVDFVVHVSNIGAGEAEKISLRLKSAAGEDLFLERGRGEIEKLAAGTTKSVRMRFRVREEQEREQLPLQLTIYDGATGEWLEDELNLTAVAPTGPKAIKKKASGVLVTEVPLLLRPAADSPVLATLGKGAAIRSDAIADEYWRVDLGEAGFGFVPAASVKPKAIAKNTAVLAGLSHIPARRPPHIETDGEIGGRVVESEELVFSGRVYGRSIRDMYVTLNDEKVLYELGPKPAEGATTSPIPNDRAVELPFERRLKLQDGLNRLVVVARLDDRLVTYRHLFVSKMKGSATRVAEAAPEPAKKTAN